MVLKYEFTLSKFFDATFHLFVILGIFGAFTLYLKGFFDPNNPNILIQYGIICSFLITILISIVIVYRSFENISFENLSLENINDFVDAIFLVGKGNIKRGIFLILFIIFLSSIISTILTTFSDSLPLILSTGVTIAGVIIFFNLFQYLINAKTNWNIIANYLLKIEIISAFSWVVIHFFSPVLPQSYTILMETLLKLMVAFPVGALIGILIGATLKKFGIITLIKTKKGKRRKKS